MLKLVFRSIRILEALLLLNITLKIFLLFYCFVETI